MSPLLKTETSAALRTFNLMGSLYVAFLCFATPAVCNAQTAQPADTAVRVMSFNIRYGTANDGDNRWPLRKQLVLNTIRDFNPDLLGTQETQPMQAAVLKQTLEFHTYFGRTRNAKPNGFGEECGLLFRTKRFEAISSGHFWLSQTPDIPGSRSWDSSLPRMATWVQLWDRKTEHTLYLLNTHFDHRGKRAREEGARLIKEWTARLPKNAFVIITGDFNAAVDSTPYKQLFGQQNSQGLLDTYRQFHSNDETGAGTFNGFRGITDGARIDWIAASKNWKIKSAAIDRTNENGRYPSDHFPVTAVLEFEPGNE